MQKTVRTRVRRIFSLEVRKSTVKDIEKGKCTVLQAARELGTSVITIYRWLNKYSRYSQSNKVIVVEHKSEGYRSRELEKKISELEAALGRKQLEVEYLNKLIELANKEFKTDIKKNSDTPPLKNSDRKKGSGTGTK